MDQLRKCEQIFTEMLNNDYFLTLETGDILHIFFKKEHFQHLLGLHKLKDIPAAQAGAGKKQLIYKRIQRGELTMSQIRKSKYYHKIADRIQLFPMIESLFFKKAIVDFNPALLESCKLNAQYILYREYGTGYLQLAIGNSVSGIYPESFMYEPTKYYLSEQTLLDVVKLEIVPKTKKKKENANKKPVLS